MKLATVYLLTSIHILFLASCAKQTAPTGGPKDTIPPSLVHSIPAKNQKNYRDPQIELTFDELINLDNPKENIVITPDINKNYEIQAKKKKVILTFKEKLRDTVTYAVNFRESIKDITEKNPTKNLKVAFSTGPYIDSLIVKGLINEPLKNKPVKDATVALYQSDTFSIFKHKPSYISRTDEKGAYAIENLKPGKYYLYAFEDKNRNLLVDSKTEQYGFQATMIELKGNQTNHNIDLIKLDARPLKLTSARPYGTYFNIKLSKGIMHYKISTSQDSAYSIIGEDYSSIKVYNTVPLDSFQIKLTVADSINNQIDSTLYVKFLQKKSTPEKFAVTAKDWRLLADKGIIEGTLSFNKPILQVNHDSIYFRIDSLQTVTFTKENFRWDYPNHKITISKKIDKKLLPKPENDSESTRRLANRRTSNSSHALNLLNIGYAAIVSIEADSSAAITESLRPYRTEDLGLIRLDIQTPAQFFIVQLLNKNFEVIRTIRNQSAIIFDDLLPGEYQLRLIIDDNNDGTWTRGNISTKTPTEKIIYYLNEKRNPVINLKANWELGPLLISQ